MGPITRRNNAEIQQLRMGPPMKIRAQLVIGRWLAGSHTCQVLKPLCSLARYLHCLYGGSAAARSLRYARRVPYFYAQTHAHTHTRARTHTHTHTHTHRSRAPTRYVVKGKLLRWLFGHCFAREMRTTALPHLSLYASFALNAELNNRLMYNSLISTIIFSLSGSLRLSALVLCCSSAFSRSHCCHDERDTSLKHNLSRLTVSARRCHYTHANASLRNDSLIAYWQRNDSVSIIILLTLASIYLQRVLFLLNIR